MRNNIITKTDSYKLTHWTCLPKETDYVYSYYESRIGAKFPTTSLFGLQYQIKEYMLGKVVTPEKIAHAKKLSYHHFGSNKFFNENMWNHICYNLDGHLPLYIMAVPEGLPVPTSNVLVTVVNTDPICPSLTNAIESMITHIWYSSTVATLSRYVKTIIKKHLDDTSDNPNVINYMLHDFGYRGATTDESAAIAGAAHILNFMGTDTLIAMEMAIDYYNAPYENLAHSVLATEHSIMTALGKNGESSITEQVINDNPTGIISLVGDSYDIYNFVEYIVGHIHKEKILARDGVFVVRPDSITPTHKTPEDLTLWILQSLSKNFGYSTNSKGFKVLDPHIRIIWGDGIDSVGIDKILCRAAQYHFSAENFVFGMGGGLVQKDINRDTQRFAFKSSSQYRDGNWHDIYKMPLDTSKSSKKGHLRLIEKDGLLITETTQPLPINEIDPENILVPVFHNGNLLKDYNFETIRKIASIL